ncbi:hypothetical protein BH10ACI2_BH10ACI2_02850 [soil metagenome]
MNRIIYSSLVLFLSIFALQTIASAQAAQTVPLYRLFLGDHFYTTNKAERDSAVQNAGYRDEGIAGYVYATSQPGTVELRRFVKETNRGTRHYYATTRAEFVAAQQDGYKSEGACCYVSKEAVNGAVPFYQLYLKPKNPSGINPAEAYGDDHLYTTNEKEKYDAINKFQYVIQPTAGYIWTATYPRPPIRKPQ